MAHATCTVGECDKPARSAQATWCAMHYHRWYRHGDVQKTAARTDITVSLGRRYRTVTRHGHPLAASSGKVYVHRLVLFELIGFGPHLCHWCRTPIGWRLPRGNPRALQVDHLNNDSGDNSPENLVASCGPCNGARGAQRRADALRADGWWSNHDTIAALATPGRVERVDPAA